MQMLRAAGYARYSTDYQCSTDVQFDRIGAWCRANGLELDPNHLYSDEGMSGMSMTRRADFTAMVSAAHAHEFDAIVFYDLTRGSRDVVDWFSFRRDMRAAGVRVYSTLERLGDIDNPGDFLTELISVGMGQNHVLTSRKKSMDRVDYLAAKGLFLGGVPNLGYDIVDQRYHVNEVEADAVRLIWRMYGDGASYEQILAALPPGFVGKRGKPLGKNSLHSILTCKRYLGIYTWCEREVKYMTEWAGGRPSSRAVEIPDAIPRIVDEETARRVMKRMSENRKNRTNNGGRKREYLLTGLLFCGACGGSYVGNCTTNRKGHEYRFYACSTKQRTKTCNNKNINADRLELLVVHLLRASILDGSMIEATADRILAAARERDGRSDVGKLRRDIDELEGKIANLARILARGIESEALLEELQRFEAEKKLLQGKLEAAGPISGPVTREELIKELEKDAARLREDPRCIKELLHKYIVRIIIYDDRIDIQSTADLTAGTLPGGVELAQNPGDNPSGGPNPGIGNGAKCTPATIRIHDPKKRPAFCLTIMLPLPRIDG